MVKLIFETDDSNALRHIIEDAGGTVTAEYANVDMLAADIPPQALKDVLNNPHVLRIHKDRLQNLL
jgi:hypothetical protein